MRGPISLEEEERFCAAAPPSISAVASASAVSRSASWGATASARASFSESVVLGWVAIVWSGMTGLAPSVEGLKVNGGGGGVTDGRA